MKKKIKFLDPHWDIDCIKKLHIDQAPEPSIGFDAEPGINLDS